MVFNGKIRSGLKQAKFFGIVFVFVFSFLSYFPNPAIAFNEQINYQGKLTNNSNTAVPDGGYNLRFRLCTTVDCSDGADPLWTETHCYSPDDGVTCDGTGTDQRVQTSGGVFNTLLGSVTSLSSVDFNTSSLYLEVQVGGPDATPSWQTLSPAKRLGTVPSAMEAKYLGGRSSTEFAVKSQSETITGSWTFENNLAVNANSLSPALSVNQSSTDPGAYAAIFTGGNVGIGTTTADAVLAIQAPTNDVGLSVSDGVRRFAVALSDDPESTGVMMGSQTQNPLFLAAGDFIGLTVDNVAGNVGIGTTTPAAKLDVAGDVIVSGASTLATTTITFGSAGSIRFDFETLTDGTPLPMITFNNPGLGAGVGSNYVGAMRQGLFLVESDAPDGGYIDGNPVLLFSADNPSGDNIMVKYATTTNVLNFLNGDGYNFDNNVGIGTTTPAQKLNVVGSEGTGQGVAVQIYNTATNGFGLALLKAVSGDGTMGGQIVGSDSENLIAYGVVNGLTLGPVSTSQDIGFAVGPAIVNGNGAPAMIIKSTGNVGIGTTTPTDYKLTIDSGDDVGAGLGVRGYVKATSYITGTTTLDLAETYPISEGCAAENNCPNVGDAVCLSEKGDAGFVVEQCSSIYSVASIGVISTQPGMTLGGTPLKSKGLFSTSTRPVALSGRVPVKVSTAAGAIKTGDYLTTSMSPGMAMKATESGRVLGIALTSFGDDSLYEQGIIEQGEVMVFVNPHWNIGRFTEEGVFADVTTTYQTGLLDQFTLAVASSLKKLGLFVKDGIARVTSLFAGEVTTDRLCVGETCLTESQLKDLLQKNGTLPDIQTAGVSSSEMPSSTITVTLTEEGITVNTSTPTDTSTPSAETITPPLAQENPSAPPVEEPPVEPPAPPLAETPAEPSAEPPAEPLATP